MSKPRISNEENKIYLSLLFINLFGLITEIFATLIRYNFPNMVITFNILLRLITTYFVLWPYIFFLYIVTVSLKRNIIFKRAIIILFVECFLAFCLPFDVVYIDGIVAYTSGLGIYYTYLVGGVDLILCLYFAVKYKSNIGLKKEIPIILLIVFYIIASLIAAVNPQLLIVSSVETFITVLMYFTIENPDLKILEEISRIKDLTEKTYDDKSTFIYRMNDEINSVLNNVKEKINVINNELDENTNIQNTKNNLKEVVALIDSTKKRFNSINDISEIDSKELKNVSNKYNVVNLLNQIIAYNKDKVKDNVEFRSSISSSLPDLLYGDSIKVKQIINSLLDNSIKNTYSGFIELRVSCIIKYDVCRLIITVQDSGTGIDLVKQNEILSDKSELSLDDIKNKDDLIINLKTIKKIVNVIGGTLSIESLNSNGTTINVTLDQKMVNNDIGYLDKDLNNYKNIISSQKHISVISNNEKNVRVVKSIGKKNGDVVESFDMTKTCLDKIRNGESFNIVVIDEEMDKIDARSFLDKVRQVDSFKGKVFVITKKKSINLKKELKEYGFDAVLIDPLNKKDIEDNFK